MTSVAVTRHSLLLIDDDPSVIASLRLLFKADYDIHEALTVKDGIRLFALLRPRVVILDLLLPDESGIACLREIRKIDPAAAVLILTGYSTRLAAEEALRLGAMDYINKPFNTDDLRRRIARLVLSTPPRFGKIPDPPVDVPLSNLDDMKDLQNASAAFLHDVAGPLSCLMAGSDLLTHKVNGKEDVASGEITSVVTMMNDSVQYLRALVEQWRSFADLQVLRKDSCDAREAIELAVSQVTDLMASSSVVFQIQAQRKLYRVPGNHYALARVLINLLKNAYESVSPVYGRIRLTITVTETTMQLTVSDNGPGVGPQQIPKLFIPQFTTKANGRGLGLFISNKIVEAIDGKIFVRSPGVMLGADFIVTLPLV